ncbi:MAG: TonB-dependent receptor [Thiobacillus sp. SCN 64-317]|nr:TonB-dependent receptor [Thiobacillus sp.]ODV12033.1 MAG: TonB-dependent receptor [Thiobacillus sp. SCN 64-317]
MRARRSPLLATSIASLLASGAVFAVDPVFELGAIRVTAPRAQLGEIAPEQVSSVVTRDAMQTYNRETVGDAVNLLSGVTVSTNLRNEQTVYLRGYDSRQVPLFIDGIPVYVPYDGYVDFGRFGTADLAAIQVAKGFSSVVYGPNTLGGAINLISRKPVKAFEGDASVGFGEEGARRAAVNLGTNQGRWYLQAGAAYREADGFRLSGDFTPTPFENGGRRDNSYYKDDKLSLKLGLTPGGGDEYALTYIKQNGEKGQPPSTVPPRRYWQWPYWDKESLYFVSSTGLSEHETLKLRLYLDKFGNEVDSYTDATYTTLKTTSGGGIAFVGTGRSIYADKTHGGSIELESRRVAGHTLRFVAHYKNDRHEETDANGTLQANMRDTLKSLAVEDVIALGEKTSLTFGFAHHQLVPDKVYKAPTVPASPPYDLPGKQTANDPQIGLFHDLSPASRLYATVAQKTRLPSLKDRYSARLGNFIPNPDLKAEQAVNYELGWQGAPWAGATAEAALFYNDVDDKIQEVRPNPAQNCGPGNQCQMRNVGEARMKGIELGLKTPIGSQWEVGGNVTWMDIENVSNPTVKLTGIPETKLILHALWRPLDIVDLIAFAERDGGRWASDTVKINGFTTLNLKAVWRPMKALSAEAGVNNATDKNYELDYGFPAAGRMWFANLGYRF